jgi:hypothetical protein
MTIDYNYVEKIIMEVESKFNVQIIGIAYDRYNCLINRSKA